MSKKLYSLIRSLSPNEKGYFKKFSAMHVNGSENVYMNLFESFSKMNEYNKLLLPPMFRKQRMETQLPAYTNYLFANILDALKIYNARKNVDSEIRHMLLDVEILFNKGLYPESGKILSKAKAVAHRYERLVLIIEIINWEEKLARANLFLQAFARMIDAIHSERLEILEKLKISAEYNWLHNRIADVVQQIGRNIKSKAELIKMEEVMKHPLLKEEARITTLSDKYTFYFIHALYNYFKLNPDFEKHLWYTRKRKELLENNIEWASQDINGYITVLQNLESFYLHTFNVAECDRLIEDLKKMPERFGGKIGEKEEIKRLAELQSMIIGRCLISGEFDKGLDDIRGKESEWEKVHAKLGKLNALVFYDNIRSLFFAVQDYKNALFWNNKIINDKVTEMNPELYTIAIIWNIIIHCDMENFELAASLTRSAQRMLKKKNKLYPFEYLFLQNMQIILKAKNEDEQETKNIFSDFQKKLIALKQSTTEIMELDYISYIAWMDSHIEKKSYFEVYKKHLENRR
jgi:hypothetical protein